MASQAEQEVTALTIKAMADENKLAAKNAELNALKKQVGGLPKIVDATITTVTAGAIGVVTGMQHGGDQAKKDAQLGYVAGIALVAGAGGAIAAGSNNPRARSALMDIGVAGAATLAFQAGEKEGVSIALQQMKARAQQPAAGAAPGVQGVKR